MAPRCKMKITILILQLVVIFVSSCPEVNWQRPGKSSLLKWAKNSETYNEGSLNVKLLMKRSYLKSAQTEFTLAFLIQKCLPDIKIHSEFSQGSVITKNCETNKKAFTLVTLNRNTFLRKKQLTSSHINKDVVGFNALISGLPLLNNQTFECSTWKNRNCIYPFYVGIAAESADLACLAEKGLTNQP